MTRWRVQFEQHWLPVIVDAPDAASAIIVAACFLVRLAPEAATPSDDARRTPWRIEVYATLDGRDRPKRPRLEIDWNEAQANCEERAP